MWRDLKIAPRQREEKGTQRLTSYSLCFYIHYMSTVVMGKNWIHFRKNWSTPALLHPCEELWREVRLVSAQAVAGSPLDPWENVPPWGLYCTDGHSVTLMLKGSPQGRVSRGNNACETYADIFPPAGSSSPGCETKQTLPPLDSTQAWLCGAQVFPAALLAI